MWHHVVLSCATRTVPQPRRRLEYSPPWKQQISQKCTLFLTGFKTNFKHIYAYLFQYHDSFSNSLQISHIFSILPLLDRLFFVTALFSDDSPCVTFPFHRSLSVTDSIQCRCSIDFTLRYAPSAFGRISWARRNRQLWTL